jgi:hypothetical protein
MSKASHAVLLHSHLPRTTATRRIYLFPFLNFFHLSTTRITRIFSSFLFSLLSTFSFSYISPFSLLPLTRLICLIKSVIDFSSSEHLHPTFRYPDWIYGDEHGSMAYGCVYILYVHLRSKSLKFPVDKSVCDSLCGYLMLCACFAT